MSNYSSEDYIISEKDFYPPEDKRYLCSGIKDIDEENNFKDYVKNFFDEYKEDIFD